MVVRGALALELVPGSQPGRAALRQTEAGALAERVGRDLATLAGDIATRDLAALDLVFAGAHYDPAEMLRPGWPLHRRLEELHARAPQAAGPRVIAFGADAEGVVPLPLRAELELHGGPLRVVPFLLVGPAAQATAVACAAGPTSRNGTTRNGPPCSSSSARSGRGTTPSASAPKAITRGPAACGARACSSSSRRCSGQPGRSISAGS